MALDSRFQSILDDFDDFPFDPSLRIPPLQDPIPLIPSRRPSPLEPNARVNDGTHSATAKLTSRSKALAEALPIDDGPPGLYHSRAKSNIPSTKSVAPPEAPRKRQKIELPKPTTRSKTNKPPPFNPIPALNEPPPSAALFPPITPNALYDTQDQTQHQPSLLKTNFARRKSSPIPVEDPVPEIIEKEVYGKGKRVYTRGRRHWTDSETEDLLKGIGIYGVGKWKKILNHERFSFHQERTTVDLKDRYRTCRMNEERALERQAVLSDDDNDPEAMPKGSPDAHNSPKRNESVAKEGIIINSPVKTAKDNVTSSPPAARPSTRSSAEENVVSATTPSPIDGEILPRQKLASKWTREEDACLSKGYQKWGPQWAAIARDSDLCLSGRTSSQVRDRFRSKYPAHYQAAPINRSTKALQKAPRAKANPTKTRLSTDSGTPPPPPGEFKFVIQDSSKAPEPGKHRLLREPSQLDGEKGGPSDHTPSIERDSSLSSQTMVQPSPDPDPDDDDTGSNVSGQRSRPSSVEVEEARHIGVLGLLNDDEEQSGRLPPFKFAFDDDDWGSDSVTLPPLLWEEMSNRPIFEM